MFGHSIGGRNDLRLLLPENLFNHVELNTSSLIYEKFKNLFKREPLLIRSPGRINFIGEHTDYNNGFVMPAAIDRESIFAIAESDSDTSIVYSVKYDEFVSVDLGDLTPVKQPLWANYLLGVLQGLVNKGYIVKPFFCTFGGNVPLGAGLSSSASIECGFGMAIAELNKLPITRQQLIEVAHWSEHHYAGVKCGIMDQFASMMGAANRAILLDCQSMEYEYLPFDMKEVAIVLCDTKVKHALVSSDYNKRREECETGVAILQKHIPGVKSLRDVDETTLRRHEGEFPPVVFNRCLYVVQEIERVRQAANDLRKNDLKTFGQRMFQTHDGLSTLYQVSCEELDFLADKARNFPGVLGARMMGGGFGGCTINLVEPGQVNAFIQHMKILYNARFGINMEEYIVGIKPGTSVVGKQIASMH